MTSDKLVTTFDIPADRKKTFFFNKETDHTEAEAKKFCKKNRMKFPGIREMEPYTLHTWQHYKTVAFDAECDEKSCRFFCGFGKF
jgi:hypothetical protein